MVRLKKDAPNTMRWQNVLPVAISVGVIIFVAIMEKQNRLVAAVTTTMPLTAPLALWIVYSSANGDRIAMTDFSRGMLFGVVPTLGFLVVVWLAARAGYKLLPILGFGYGAWVIGLIILIGLKRLVEL